MIIRDWGLLWAMSLLFEVLEVTFQEGLPNFNECWWDHLIIDVLVCNYGGMAAGMWLVKKFSQKGKYVFVDESKEPKTQSLLVKFLLNFTPLTWTTYRWDIFGSFKRWAQTVSLVVVFEINELCSFGLKSALWIPPPHIFNTLRLVLWAVLAFPAIREYVEVYIIYYFFLY